MPRTLTWLSGTTTTAVAAILLHAGPLLVALIVLIAVALVAVVVTYVAAVFRTGPRKNLVALIKAWRWPPRDP